MSRVKRGCCFRLEYGPRAGRLCGAELTGYSRVVDTKLGSELIDFCHKHQELITRRREKAGAYGYRTVSAPAAGGE